MCSTGSLCLSDRRRLVFRYCLHHGRGRFPSCRQNRRGHRGWIRCVSRAGAGCLPTSLPTLACRACTFIYSCRDAGISLAFVKLAAKQLGTRVIIADLRLTPEAAQFVTEARNVVFAKCDVAVWPDLQSLIKVSEEEFGDVPDVYVAGAAVFEPVCSPS